MIVLLVFVLGLVGSALTYGIGRMRTEARWNSRLSLAWRRYGQRVAAGEDILVVANEEFGDLNEKMKTWTVADGKRLVAEDRRR